MHLPNAALARLPEAKVRGYLLSPHGKLGFFMRFGFAPAHWQVLAAALHAHAQQHEVTATVDTEHGVKYTVDGVLASPDGRNPFVRVIWIVDNGETVPRLVSAFPGSST